MNSNGYYGYYGHYCIGKEGEIEHTPDWKISVDIRLKPALLIIKTYRTHCETCGGLLLRCQKIEHKVCLICERTKNYKTNIAFCPKCNIYKEI